SNAGTTPLSIGNAASSLLLPGNGSGLSVDSAGNVFFSANDQSTGVSTLGMLDTQALNGVYDPIYSSSGSRDYFGPISVDGNFLNGGTLYFNPGVGFTNSVVAIEAVPEPSTVLLSGGV